MRRRLMTGLLCIALLVGNIAPTGLQVQAAELTSASVTGEAEGVDGENPTDTEKVSELPESTDESENSEKTGEDSTEESGEDSTQTDEDSIGESDEDSEKSEENDEEDAVSEENMEKEDSEDTESEEISEEDETGDGAVEEAGSETELKTVTSTSELMSSNEIIASGSYGLIKWDIDVNGKLTVVGEGDITSISREFLPYRDKVISAEVKVTNSTSATTAFENCSNLESVDLSGFDASKLTRTNSMFIGCKSLTSVDLSGWDTNEITNMSQMFQGCSSLTKVELSGLSTQYVTDMSWMFQGCSSLTNIDLGGFDTGNVTTMRRMFDGCSSLTDIDLSGFDKCQLLSAEEMFKNCSSLRSVDLSGLDGSKVYKVADMFNGCSSLRNVDLSGLDTSEMTSVSRIFYNCSKLSSINLDGWDFNQVNLIDSMFFGCDSLTVLDLSSVEMSGIKTSFIPGPVDMLNDATSLTTIYTPVNLKQEIALPAETTKDAWYQADGTQIYKLPLNLNYSIVIKKNEKPVIPNSYITVSKTKTSYICGEAVNTDDIKVTYYGSDGSARKLSAEDYTTNIDEIDMSTPGKKTLVITYEDLTADIELSFNYLLREGTASITLPDTVYRYNGISKKPMPIVTLTDTSVILSNGTDYTVSYADNINAGDSAKVIITGQGDYSGTITKTFSIGKAQLEIKALDVVLAVGDKAADSDFSYQVVGLAAGDRLAEEPSYTFTYQGMDGDSQASVELSGIDTSKTGIYTITPYGADAGNNYEIVTYTAGILTIAEERIIYTVTFDLQGKTAKEGTAPADLAGITGVTAGSLISEPKEIPQAEGYTFAGWYRDQACTKAWNFDTDTVQQDTTLYALWLTSETKTDPESGITGADLCIQEIPAQTYTGSALKPAVKVYAADGTTLLKAGKDYTIKYYNNIEADTEEEQLLGGTDGTLSGNAGGFTDQLAYVSIAGKGNYTGTLYSNFHIRQASIADGSGSPAKGVTLKYTEQFVTANKVQKPFSSIKYKKAMKAGKDYTVTLTAQKAYAADGTARTAGEVYDAAGIPKGYSGTFTLTITGKGNYTGTIVKTIYVADKTHLMKNAAITLGKDLKTRSYDEGREIILQPGYYKAETKKYYKVDNGGTISTEQETNANGIYTVKFGKQYLVYGKDYTVSYRDNKAVGTATMTITGTGDYTGSKSVTFKITGTAFNTKNITTEGIKNLTYTGKALTQNKNMVLKTKDGTALIYGKHYTVTYTNNLKKGTAKMTFTAKPDSGYSGSFTKNFKITQAQLADAVLVTAADESSDITNQGSGTLTYTGTVSYTREGAKPIDRITLRNQTTGAELKAGTDYTVGYANNTAVTTEAVRAAGKTPVMKVKGKGNYAGTINIAFSISEASLAERQAEGGLKAAATATVFDAKKADTYQYQPKIKVTDGKKTLSAKKDYTVTYENCSQAKVKAYLEALANGTGQDISLEKMRPRAVITAVNGSGYSGSVTADLEIFGTKLTGSNLYIIVEEKETTYTGAQVTPEVTVYYGDSKAIKAAKNAKITDEGTLTNQEGSYKFIKLKPKTDGGIGNYTLTYGVNIAAGKNKGTVTVTGTGLYGGSVTAKFTIRSRDVFTSK